MDYTKYRITRNKNNAGSEIIEDRKLNMGRVRVVYQPGTNTRCPLSFPMFKPGKTFYVELMGALRAARLIGIRYLDDLSWNNDGQGVKTRVVYDYQIAGFGEYSKEDGLAAYESIEDYKSKRATPQAYRIDGDSAKRKICEDLSGIVEVDLAYTNEVAFFQWYWDGTKAVRKQVSNFNLSYDGTRFIIAIKDPIAAAVFPSKELCEAANEIKVIEF